MTVQRTLFELSGEHPTLPAAEVVALLETYGQADAEPVIGPGFVIASAEERHLDVLGARLALTHRFGRYLGSCAQDELGAFASRLELPDGSVSVRARRFGGTGSPDDSVAAVRRASEAVTKGRKVDLAHADVQLRIHISDRLHFFISERSIDRDQYETRHVRSRPFFSPISLHPRYARALVNLTRVMEGETILDPFCGTGGVLLEASLMGIRAIGSDLSREMIDGCRRNMGHFGAKAESLVQADVGEIPNLFGKVDAVATDPPYGRSASTMKEPVRELHLRGLDAIADVLGKERMAGVVLPWECSSRNVLDLHERHAQRVHRSLTRNYCVFKRR